jgi:MFS family permease
MRDPAASPRRTLTVLCLASAGWAFSFGLGAPLAALWLRDAGFGTTLQGLNTSVYYLGVALAAPALPPLMRRSARRCVLAGMLLSAAATALFPWCDGLAAWFALRALTGVGTALCLIPMETLVNQNAPPDRRARDFACYAVAVALGVGAGPVIGLPLYAAAPRGAFALGGLLPLLAVGVVLGWFPAVGVAEEDRGDAPVPVRDNLLGFGTAWLQGFLEGGMMTFLSVYLLALGYTEDGASGLMAALFAGVLLFQLPAGWLADRLGRTRLVLGCHAVVFLGLLALPCWDRPATLGVELFFVGGCSAALYPLGLALLGERLPPAALARANAWYLACNCAGSVIGPVLMGLAVDFFGNRALFAAGALAVVAVVATHALRPPAPVHEGLPSSGPADASPAVPRRAA